MASRSPLSRSASLPYPRLMALAAGAVSALGFEPLGLWPVSLAALVLLLHLLITADRRRSAFVRGWLFGVGYFSIGLNWIATAFTFQAAMPAWLGWVAVVALSLYLAVYPGLAALAGWWIGKGRPLILIIAMAGSWAIAEWLRSWVITGFAWNPLGVLAVGFAWPSTVIGTYGLSALVLLMAGALHLAAVQRAWSASLIALVPILLAGGAAHVLTGLTPPPGMTSTLVTVVQPNINQDVKWDPAVAAENFARLASNTVNRSAPAKRIIFWPEAAIPDYLEDGYPQRLYYPLSAAGNRARITNLIEPGNLLVTGGLKLDFNRQGQAIGAANSVFALDSGGTILGSYDKAHLVPFGEYLPLEALLSQIGLQRLVPGAFGFTPGPGPQTLDLPGYGKMGLQVCYEMIFSGEVIDAANRPDFVFNPSNDAWFGGWGPPQHLAQARLRAIEEAVPVIRSTPTGISAVIDARGRVITSIAHHQSGHIDALLPAPGPPTPFARFGNLLALGFAGLLLIMAVALRFRDR